jgi:hypothetical protein
MSDLQTQTEVHALIGAGGLVWLVGAYVGAALLVIRWLSWFFSRSE